MSPEVGLAATRLALFLIVGSGLMLLAVSRDSAEFVVLVLTIGVGAVMLGLVALLARLGKAPWTESAADRHDQDADDRSDDRLM